MQKAPRPDGERAHKQLPKSFLLLGYDDATPWHQALRSDCQSHAPNEHVLVNDGTIAALEQLDLGQTPGPILVLDLLAFAGPAKAKSQPTDAVEAAIAQSQRRRALALQLQQKNRQRAVPTRLQWLALVPTTGWREPSRDAGAASQPRAAELFAGVTAGAIKSLGQEWQIWHKIAYIDPASAPADWLGDELYDSARYPEVLYQDGERRLLGLHATPADISPSAPSLPPKPVFVITGGGAGITAVVARAMATQLGPFRALVLGRTIPATDAESQLLSDRKASRQRAREALGPEASARDVQEAVQKGLRRVALANSLASLQAAGIELMYVPTDVQDAAAVSGAIGQALAQWGQIDGVIHGAGVDKSRDLKDKTDAELDLVLGVKLRGLRHIIDALAHHDALNSVTHWVGFGSISARFGNRGQFDYAAANEALARWLTSLGGLCIDYTGWDDVGMASSLASVMKERGVDMLPSQLAAASTAQLIQQGHVGEWVLSGRLPSIKGQHVLLGKPELLIPGKKLLAARQLNTDKHRYLRDHQMQGAEIMPGVVSLMTMRRAAFQMAWQAQAGHATDVQFSKAVKVWPGRPMSLYAEATWREDATGQPQIEASLRSISQRKGQLEEVHHASATFHPGQVVPPEQGHDILSPRSVKGATRVTATEIYKTFFHGPCWQVVERAAITPEFVHATSPTLASEGALGCDLPEDSRWDAVGLELMLQAAGLWSMYAPQQFALPYGIKHWLRLASIEPESVASVHLRPTGQQDDLFLFDGTLLDPSHRPLQQVFGLQMRIFPLP